MIGQQSAPDVFAEKNTKCLILVQVIVFRIVDRISQESSPLINNTNYI